MRVNVKRARDIKTRAREAENISIFFAAGASSCWPGACRPRTRETGPWRSAAVRKNKWTFAFTQVSSLIVLLEWDSSPARSDAGGASRGVIAMLEKTLIDLAALATIAQFVLDLWRGRKTRPEDADDKKNGQ